MYISVDMGATKTRIAVSSDLITLAKVKRFYTNKNSAVQKNLISSGIKELLGTEKLEKICIGVPGTFDTKEKIFNVLPNYKELNGKPFEALIDNVYLSDCIVENDATLGAVGESIRGAGEGYQKVGYISLGSGVGGALVTKTGPGKFDYMNDEPGHMIIIDNGRINSSCGHAGCFEAYASGHSFENIFAVKPQNSSDGGVWKKYAEYVSMGLTKLHTKWKCDVFVIGGSMALEFSLFSEYLSSPVPVLRSLTLDDAGVYGGLVLIKRSLS